MAFHVGLAPWASHSYLKALRNRFLNVSLLKKNSNHKKNNYEIKLNWQTTILDIYFVFKYLFTVWL